MTLEALRADLIARWKAAFDRIAEVDAKPQGAVETVYTQVPAFALANYTPKKFKPGTRVSRTPSGDGDDYAFRLDAQGRPLHVKFAHRVNRVSWKGVYRYGPEEVEHIEFCMETRVPSLYNRLVLAGPSVVAEQRFIVNSGGSANNLTRLSSKKKIQEILADPHEYFIYLTRYQVEGGVTRSAEEYQEVSGEVHRPTLEYRYGEDGKLQRIVQHWESGEQRTVFAARTKATSRDLADELSTRIADQILARLARARFAAPLLALELNYREGEHPVPQLIPLTEGDEVGSLALAAEIPPARWIELSGEAFAPAIVELAQRAEAAESHSAIAAMLRVAARRVTERARADLPVSGDFVAFAIDWELEGDQIAAILKQCGASPQRMREWKKKGWL